MFLCNEFSRASQQIDIQYMFLHPKDIASYIGYMLLPKRTLVILLLLSTRQLVSITHRYNKHHGPIKTTHRERARIVALVKRAGPIALNFIFIVKPGTVKHWMHEFAISIHTLRSRFGKLKNYIKQKLGLINKPGRKRLPKEVIKLIIKIKSENMHLGAGQIRGILWKKGIFISRAKINLVLRRHFPYKPRPGRGRHANPELTWAQFFFALKEGIHAMDMFSIFTFFGRQLFCFFIIDHSRRRCIHFAFTSRPNPAWIWNEIKRAYRNEIPPEKLIADNDTNFSPWLAKKVKHELNIEIHRTTPQSPWENAVAERFIRTVREELFNRLPPVLSSEHAERLMTQYLSYYNFHRPHDTLAYDSPNSKPTESRTHPDSKLKRIPVFHGLWNRYIWA